MSVGGELPSGCCPEPTYEPIVQALDYGLEAIVEALTQIDETLNDKLEKDCSIISECADEILAMIEEVTLPLALELEQVQSDVRYLLDSTYELQQQYYDLATCVYEGLCPDGTPEQEPPKPKKQYYGWCSITGGEALVTDNPIPPGPDFTVVAVGDDEQVVFDEALNTCKTYSNTAVQTGIEPKELPPATSGQITCDIGAYTSPSTLSSIIGSATGVFSTAGLQELFHSLAEFGLEGINLGNIGQMIAGAVNYWSERGPAIARKTLPSIAKSIGCANDNWLDGMQAIGALGMLEHASGVDVMPYATSLEYAINASCRRKFLNPDKATEAYLANAIKNVGVLDTYYAIEGVCSSEVGIAIQTLKEKPTSGELLEMLHRRLIDFATYQHKMRELGYIDVDVVNNIFATSIHEPDIQAVTRFAANFAGDDGNASRYTLDFGYDTFYQGEYERWITGHGITPEEAKQVWRSHWSTPAVSNLFEFWHRLREDDTFGTADDLLADIKAAMTSQGIPPFWQDRLLACSEYPLLKRDIRVAYGSGALHDDNLEKSLRVTGHNQEAIDVLVKELRGVRRKEILSHIALRNWTSQHISGVEARDQLSDDGYEADTIDRALRDSEHQFSSSTWSEAYTRGMLRRDDLVSSLTEWGVSDQGANRIADKLSYKLVDHHAAANFRAGTQDRNEAEQAMQRDGLRSPVIDKTLNDATEARNNTFAMECTRGIRQRYTLGELDYEEAVNALLSFGISHEFANSAVDAFSCARKSEGKEISVEKLCSWLSIGAIAPDEMYRRLIKMGYDDVNASMLISDCVRSNIIKANKEQERVAKAVESQLEKERRAVDKVNSENRRNAERLARMRKQKATLRANRDKQLISVVEKVFTGTKSDLQSATNAAQNALASAQSQFGLSVDDALRILLIATDLVKGNDVSQFEPIVMQLAATAAHDGLEPTDADVAFIPSSNGNTQPEASA